MRTLKQIIDQVLSKSTNFNTAYYRYEHERNTIILMSTVWKQEKSAMAVSNWSQEDKCIIMEFYDKHIDKLANDLFWLETFYELNIIVKE